MDRTEQDGQLLDKMLEVTFFDVWKSKMFEPDRRCSFPLTYPDFPKTRIPVGNYSNLELCVDYECDLACKYCYIHNFKNEYYKGADSRDVLKKNAGLVLDWIIKNKMYPSIELFGGEALSKPIGYDILDMILEKKKEGHFVTGTIVIPTNMNFLFDDKKTERVKSFKKKFTESGTNFGISASVDGVFMEENRPFKNPNMKRNEWFYNRLFTWDKDQHFHPMIYSNGIERWIDNYEWFQEMFRMYGFPWWRLYLLEVRNAEWSEEQCAHLYKFVKHLVHSLWDKTHKNPEAFWDGIHHKRGFNILNGPISTGGRGIGCGIQNTFYIRLADLGFHPCHRLAYKPFQSGKFKVEGGEIVGMEPMNVSMFMAIHGMDSRMFPVCESCSIRELCPKGCLGAQFENTGDPFTPVPTMCRMEHYKLAGYIEGLMEIGMLNDVVGRISPVKADAIKLFKREALNV